MNLTKENNCSMQCKDCSDKTEYEMVLKREIMLAGQFLYNKGLINGLDGNMSIRLSENEMLITASGFCKGMLDEDKITKTDLDGNVICGIKPARDIGMHLAVYKHRPDVKAIAHAHPPVTTGLSVCKYDFSGIDLPEAKLALGHIAFAYFAMPATPAVAESVSKALMQNQGSRAVVLEKHGALTFGADIMDAFFAMETLELISKTLLYAKLGALAFGL